MAHLLHSTIATLLLAFAISSAIAENPLPSWNEGKSKEAIISFVTRTTTEGTPDFIPPAERVAVFDNDGTLWPEKPVYFQLGYVIDRIRKLAPQHPEWTTTEPFASILKGDLGQAMSGGHHAILELVMATHAGMTSGEFASSVRQWLDKSSHPGTGRPYQSMAYQPMLELLEYLRSHGFKTYIVSGGGIDFMRVFAEETYGIPPEQVIGSSLKAKYDLRNGKPVIVKLPEIDFIDDKDGKPVGIQRHIGRRPVFAAGNSDGDFQMLEWTTTSGRPGFGLLMHHTDSEREWAYDRISNVGKLSRGLDEAADRGWIVVDMQKDWKTIYPE